MITLNREELEATSVITRSASRKYATLGAFLNKVNVDEELKRIKHWPENISYAIPVPSNNVESLKNVVTEAFFKVATFCKLAKDESYFSNTHAQETVYAPCEYQDLTTNIDFSVYSTREGSKNDGDEKKTPPKSKENLVSCQPTNMIPYFEDHTDVCGEAFYHENNQLIALYEEPRTLEKPFDIKLSTETINVRNLSRDYAIGEGSLENTTTAVHHSFDHSYMFSCNKQNENNRQSSIKEQGIFTIDDALNGLMLNTAILKCLVCGELPQDIASFLNQF